MQTFADYIANTLLSKVQGHEKKGLELHKIVSIFIQPLTLHNRSQVQQHLVSGFEQFGVPFRPFLSWPAVQAERVGESLQAVVEKNRGAFLGGSEAKRRKLLGWCGRQDFGGGGQRRDRLLGHGGHFESQHIEQIETKKNATSLNDYMKKGDLCEFTMA